MALAEREYRAAITASHSGAFAWFELANFLFHAGRLDEMDQAMHALESSPVDRPESLRDAATVLQRADRDYPLAVRLLRRYLSTPVEEAPAFEAHDVLGHLLEKEGNHHAAADEYRAALALAHGYTRAQEDLRRVER
jgi:tetratricopeptide (TPR) repeat protein